MTFPSFIAYSGVLLSILFVLGFWKLIELTRRLRDHINARWFPVGTKVEALDPLPPPTQPPVTPSHLNTSS